MLLLYLLYIRYIYSTARGVWRYFKRAPPQVFLKSMLYTSFCHYACKGNKQTVAYAESFREGTKVSTQSCDVTNQLYGECLRHDHFSFLGSEGGYGTVSPLGTLVQTNNLWYSDSFSLNV